MDLNLTEEQDMIVAMVRRFVREEIIPLELNLDPDADALEEEDRLRLIEKTKEMGLYGLDIPPEYGGPDIDLVTRTLIAIEMSQHRAGLYAPVLRHVRRRRPGAAVRGDRGTEREVPVSDPARRESAVSSASRSPPAAPTRRAPSRPRRCATATIGSSTAASSGSAAPTRPQFGLVFARTDADKGRNGVTCFIVDTDMPGFHVRRIVHTLRSAHYATELQFEDLRVPDSNILGKVNGGFAIANDRLTRQRIPYAAGCIGVAIKAQELALEYVPQRETFGAPLSSRQAIQWMLVDNEMDIKQSTWITLEAANKANNGEPFRKEAAMAKLVATEAGGRVVDRSMQMFGGLGVAKDLPFERWFREMRIRRIGEGPSEVQRHVIARELLGSSLR